MISSTKNPRIIHIRKLQNSARLRRQEGVFIIEGVRLVEEAVNAGWQPEIVLYTEELDHRGRDILNTFSTQGAERILVSKHVMQAASDTQSPQGILALLPIPSLSIPEQLNFILILDGLRDPGNMGTILRAALAAGVNAILLPPDTVDPFSPKVVRAAMGAHFNLPLLPLTWGKIIDLVQSKHLSTFLADSAAGQPYDSVDYTSPLALIIGGEATGAGSIATALSPQRVHIPMIGTVESLNAAIATAVLIFEVARQRRNLGPATSCN